MRLQEKPKSNENLKGNIYPLTFNENSWYNKEGSSGGNGGSGDMSKYVTKDELNKEFELFDSRIDNKFKDLKLELKDQHTSNIRWMIGTSIAVVSAITAIVGILVAILL